MAEVGAFSVHQAAREAGGKTGSFSTLNRALDPAKPDFGDTRFVFLELTLQRLNIVALLIDSEAFDFDGEFNDDFVVGIERLGRGEKSNVWHTAESFSPGKTDAPEAVVRAVLKASPGVVKTVSTEMNDPVRVTATTEDSDLEPSLSDRIAGAIWGQFVGDAFCLGSHWIYSLTELEKAFPGGVNGFETPQEGAYHFPKKSGEQTHYGEGALVMLESVAELGRFDENDFLQRFAARFGSADYSGYLDKATRGTLENLAVWREEHPNEPLDAQNGADDDQLATPSRFASVVAAHFHDPDLLEVVERATRVCQNNERAVVYMKANALILRELLAGRDLHTALHRTEETIVAVDARRGVEVRRKIAAGMNATLKSVLKATVDEFGQSCPLASSFPSSVHCAVKHGDSFEDAIVANARAGGDNAGRAGLIGAWLGALLGLAAIPHEWRDRLAARERISTAVEKILASASGCR